MNRQNVWYCSVVGEECTIIQEGASERCSQCGEENHDGPKTAFHYRHYAPIMVSAANLMETKETPEQFVLMGVRHFDPIMCGVLDLIEDKTRCVDQGFVDQKMRFWGREDAFYWATNNQEVDLDRNGSKSELYSEGLY